jgi:hypothetical protein
MKTYGGVDVWTHIFFTSALVGSEWSDSSTGCFTLGEEPRYPLIGSSVGPRTGLDDMEKLKSFTPPGLELRSLHSPVRSQSLIRLLPRLWDRSVGNAELCRMLLENRKEIYGLGDLSVDRMILKSILFK